MADSDIKDGLGFCGFGFHDITVPIVTFLNDSFRLRFCPRADFIHFPEYIWQELFLGIIHRGNFLWIIRIGIDFDRIHSKHFFPDCPTAAHLKVIVLSRGLDFR